MSPLFESILIQDGICQNLNLHEERISRSRKEFLNVDIPLDLNILKKQALKYSFGKHKMRIEYGLSIDHVDVREYVPKNIQSLKVVNSIPFDYHLKYTDRSQIQNLYKQKGNADDVIIAVDGFLTDISYANLALFDGKKWWTPEHSLLEGTRRSALIAAGTLYAKPIHVDSLSFFKKLSIINAMLDLEELCLPVSHIIL